MGCALWGRVTWLSLGFARVQLGAGALDRLPADIEDTEIKITARSQLFESSRSQVNGLADLATCTLIYDLNNHSQLLVLVVGDLHALVAVFKFAHGLNGGGE